MPLNFACDLDHGPDPGISKMIVSVTPIALAIGVLLLSTLAEVGAL